MKIISFDTTSLARKIDARAAAESAHPHAESDYETRAVDVLQSVEQDAISVMSSAATLIVADDHPLFRAALGEAVTRLLPQARIVEAGSLKMLEEAVQANPTADLILLDLRMPGA